MRENDMFKRIGLFIATNLAVILLLSIVCRVLGIDQWAAQRGMGLSGLIVFASIFGMGGAFISLAISKWMAKMTTGAKVITQPANETERWLVDTVRRHAEKAGIGMPEVAVYDAPEMNAFATGMTRNSALVAVSSGLLQQMDREQVSAVLGHEIGHVANGDMVTLTLIQGVLNTLVIVLARVVGRVVDSWMSGGRDRDGEGGIGYFVVVMVLQIVFGLFASIIVIVVLPLARVPCRRGRRQPGRACLHDLGPAAPVGQSRRYQPAADHPGLRHLRPPGHGFKRLFMSHPPIEAAHRSAAGRQVKRLMWEPLQRRKANGAGQAVAPHRR
jgi:heat shock protein HtpX